MILLFRNFLPIIFICIIVQWTAAKSASSQTKDILKDYKVETEYNEVYSEEQEVTDEVHLLREQYAVKMLSYMNQSIDPCDDFYEYACGNWKNTLVKRHSDYGRVNMVEIEFQLIDMVPNLIENSTENLKLKYVDEIKQARIFYESCQQANLFPMPKSNDYLEVIKNITGFPAIDENWNPENFDWFNATARLSVYGVVTFVNEDESSGIHPFGPFFKLPVLGFDLDVHSDNIGSNTTRGYKLNEQRMRQYLTTYGVVEPKISQIVGSVFELWHAILNVMDEFEESEEKCVELGKTKYAIAENTWKKWENYFHIVWHGELFGESANNCPCDYFYKKLDEICNERKEAVANYLAMNFLYNMDARLVDSDGKNDYCNESAFWYFRYLFDALYMAQRNLETEQSEIRLMAKYIRSTFRENLLALQWLDENTRNEALLKEAAVSLLVGRIEDAELIERIIREIKSLNMQKLSYEKIRLETGKFAAHMERYLGLNNKNLQHITKPLDLYVGFQAQGFYYGMDNSIILMAGILNPPMYHKSWPLSLKYGTLGFLIGHELTHAFDSTGAHIDNKGEERNWWTAKSQAVFEELTKCYMDKFNEYEIPEIHRKINGDNTKDENIADHGGLRFAYKAYQHHMQKLNLENDQSGESLSKAEHLKVLDLKPDQLFYLGFAQLFCNDYKEENIWSELQDEHTHPKYRVLGTLSNMGEFSESYKCPVGSKMNPTSKKCKMW